MSPLRTRISWAGALVALACLSCEGRIETLLPSAGEDCEGLTPLALSLVQTRIRVGTPVTLVTSGGSGRYSYGVAPGGSGGELRGDRFIAGPTPAVDQLFVQDALCTTIASARLEVMASFNVSPAIATVRPGTTFQLAVAGTVGYPAFRLTQNQSSATVDVHGKYTAGVTEGMDLLSVVDTEGGDQALVQIRVSAAARFRAQPDKMAAPPGSWVPLATADGTDGVTWRKLSGPGTLSDGRLLFEVGASVPAVLEAKDVFTAQTARMTVYPLGELTRSTVPHGRLTDLSSVASADFDGDGIADLAVGFPESDLGRPLGGAVFVFKGDAAGLPDQPTWTISGTTDTALFGSSLVAGDVDGDGRADLVVGAPLADVTVGDSGAVYLYRVTGQGPVPLRGPLTGLGRGSFGTSIALADVDGDGDLDLWVGSPNADLAVAANRRGVVDIYRLQQGSTINDLSDLRLSGVDLNPDGTTASRANTRAGTGMAAADLNGDGKTDLAVLCTITNSLLGGVPVLRTQTAIAIHFSRGGSDPFQDIPDAYVLPTNPLDTSEGTWRLGFVPAGEGRPPLLLASADSTDSPDLRASGQNQSGPNSGGVLLFDLSGMNPTGAPAAQPRQLGPSDAFVRIYGESSGIFAGRSFGLLDVDGNPGPELLLGAPYASPSGTSGSLRLGGKVLAYALAGLTPGSVVNKPIASVGGINPADCFGAGMAPWALPGGTGLAVVSSRASSIAGQFTGRVDGLSRGTGPLSGWSRRSAAFPARQSNEQFGAAVAAGRSATGAPAALIGSPGFSGPGVSNDGNDVGAGRAVLYDPRTPTAPAVAAEGAISPLIKAGRAVGADVTFTDFNGDGRQDMVIGSPNLQVPSSAVRATDITPYYEVENASCITASTQSVGGLQIQLGQSDGTWKPAYRLWAPADIEGCTPVGDTRCRRAGIGRQVIGGFDFNGDGIQDVAAVRNNGFEVFLGRPPDNATLAKLTMGCDPIYSAPFSVQPTSIPATVGDVDRDGCGDLAYRAADTTKTAVIIVFGFDPGGARCSGHTAPVTLRLADRDAGLNFLGLGQAITRAGDFLGDGRSYLAIGATAFPVNGVVQNAVVLYDGGQLAARRPSSGEAIVGAMNDGLPPLPLVGKLRINGFGRALAGGVDLNGDGKPELIVGAPNASVAGDGTGAVFVFSGTRGPLAGGLEPLMTFVGDAAERSSFGVSISAAPGSSGPPFLVIGAPASYRTGTQNGTAYFVPLAF